MGFFSSVWDGAKEIGKGIGDILLAIAEVVVDTVFVVLDVIFSAIDTMFDWIDNMFDKLGDFLFGQKGTGDLLPPTDEIQKIIEKHEKVVGKTYKRGTRNNPQTTIGVVCDSNGKVKGLKL